MNKTIIAVVVILLCSVGAWALLRTDPKPLPSGGEQRGLTTYVDPEGVFSFEYPTAWHVTGRDGATLATVGVPQSYLPGTNFADAVLTVNWSNASSSLVSCSGTESSSEAAAGNRYDTTTVKKVYDGDCYTFEYTIHYGNIQNYDPNQGVSEFDEAKLKGELDQVIESFTYLVNSD
jgi:hypothetical protein